MEAVILQVRRLVETARLPTRMTSGSAGYDIYSACDVTIPASRLCEGGTVEVGRALVSTGLAVAIPPGVVGRVGSRSGLSVKQNIEAGAGWIDSDYRGELMVELKNLSSKPFQIFTGDRIAQLLLLKLADVELLEVDILDETVRGVGGFGSTGRE